MYIIGRSILKFYMVYKIFIFPSERFILHQIGSTVLYTNKYLKIKCPPPHFKIAKFHIYCQIIHNGNVIDLFQCLIEFKNKLKIENFSSYMSNCKRDQ